MAVPHGKSEFENYQNLFSENFCRLELNWLFWLFCHVILQALIRLLKYDQISVD